MIWNEYEIDLWEGNKYSASIPDKTLTSYTSLPFRLVIGGVEYTPIDNNIFVELYSDCTNMVHAPKIFYGADDMDNIFSGCTSLVDAPILPATVRNISYAFDGCSALVEPPIIPPRVSGSMPYAFRGCSSLANIYELSIDNVSPISPTFIQLAYYHCSVNDCRIVLHGSDDNIPAINRNNWKPSGTGLYLDYESLSAATPLATGNISLGNELTWIAPVVDRGPTSRTVAADMNRIGDNFYFLTGRRIKSDYVSGDFVKDTDWAELIALTNTMAEMLNMSFVTSSSGYKNLNAIEKIQTAYYNLLIS